MLEKGIVMELKEDYAIALTQDGEMLRIQRKPDLQVGNKIYILPEDLYQATTDNTVIDFPQASKSTTQHHNLLQKVIGLVAILALVVGLSLYTHTPVAYAVVSFDSAQSLQLTLDKKYRIIDGSDPENQISETELETLHGKTLADIGPELQQLIGDGPLLIGYAPYKALPDYDTQTEQLLQKLFANRTTLYLTGDSDAITQSENKKVTLGRYLAEMALDDDDTEALEDFLHAYNSYKNSHQSTNENKEDELEALEKRLDAQQKAHDSDDNDIDDDWNDDWDDDWNDDWNNDWDDNWNDDLDDSWDDDWNDDWDDDQDDDWDDIGS